MSVFSPDPGDLHDYQSPRRVLNTAQWMQIARESLKNQRITQVRVDGWMEFLLFRLTLGGAKIINLAI